MYVRITLITQWQFILLSPTHFLHYYVFSPLSIYLLQDALIDLMSALAIRPKMRILLKTIVRQTVAELLGSTKDLVRMLGVPPGYFENLWELTIKIHQVASTPKESENLKSLQCESNFVSPKTAEYKLFTLFFKMYKTECKMCCNYIHHFFNEKFFSKGLQRTFSCSKLENYVTFFKILDIDAWNATLDYFLYANCQWHNFLLVFIIFEYLFQFFFYRKPSKREKTDHQAITIGLVQF